MSLLSPHDRTPLLEALRPPADHTLHTAIATTYSLDLVAMMMAPVGFTFFEMDSDAGAVGEQAPLELLEAIRRHASQMVLFCDAGHISVPSKHRPLFTYLEDRIVQAQAPTKGGSFHPKLWMLRFVGPDESVLYRMLCMSRNLTFDRCLDSILMLEGPLRAHRTKRFAVNGPLEEFFDALPGMAVPPLSEGIREQCERVAGEVGRIDWDLGDLPFDEVWFRPLGHTGRKSPWPFHHDYTRMLVAAPFVGDDTLRKLTENGSSHILLSRRVELDDLKPETLEDFREVHVMRAQPEAGEEVESETSSRGIVAASDLHAKLFIADRGWDATVWTGSANATPAAFKRNVEFLVELTGKKSKVGIDAFLDKPAGSVGMLDLLEPYVRPEVVERDTVLEALEKEIDGLRSSFARQPWTVTIHPGNVEGAYRAVVACTGGLPVWPDYFTVRCRLLSINAGNALPIRPGADVGVVFDPVSIEGLTSFLAFEICGTSEGRELRIEFVVGAQLIGEPPNRRDKILQSMLQDRRAVVRFLLLLLGEDIDPLESGAGGSGKAFGRGSMDTAESEALLEPLLRAFERHPGRLDAVAGLLRDLCTSDDGRALVPDGLDELMEAIMAAREIQVR